MSGLSIYKDVLNEDLCRFLLKNSIQELTKGRSFRSSNFQWDSAVVKSSHPVFVRDCEGVLASLVLSQLHEKNIINDLNYSVQNYAWTKLSYIPWHRDSHRRSSITLYLNEFWDRDWGGIFIYEDAGSGEVKGHVPQFNTAIKNDMNVAHAVTMITTDPALPRFTLQINSKD